MVTEAIAMCENGLSGWCQTYQTYHVCDTQLAISYIPKQILCMGAFGSNSLCRTQLQKFLSFDTFTAIPNS